MVLGNSSSFVINPSSGVPQGSVLGPLLFLIFVNDLVDRLTSKSLQLADDLKISRKIESVQDCVILQDDIKALLSWCTDNKIRLNAAKCSILTTTFKPSKIIYDYVIDDVNLTRVATKKDLGVIFDEKLSFNDKVARKAYRMLGFIFRPANASEIPKASSLCTNRMYVASWNIVQ